MCVVAVGYLLAGIVLGGSIVRRVMLQSSIDVSTKASSTDVATKGRNGSELEVITPELLDRFPATVVGITEGDRIVVEDRAGMQQSVRLFAIDAPEHDQPFGAQSTQHLASLVSGKNVNLECENDLSYEEIICKVFLPAGEDAGLAQLKAGMAWHYKQYEDEQSATGRAAYPAAECTAMKVVCVKFSKMS
jgi:endonuclease YncB( thermonuclease family)